ncbi:MAG: acetyl-CoA carboxylase biotin carboxyl carrier protein subunit [Bacteroidales bacterium]|nr:acetyl-CoA carboxylase biotin carboxyl carrier protein subunit [Bacteroidales bacterium]MBN2755800.1 acetyl-CoA carboxylase biotin carboxyl carrier protein subunit [Bacteroidales bacterium]
MKQYKFTIRGHKYDVEIQSLEDNIAEIEVNGTNYLVEINKEIKQTKTPKLVRASIPEPTRKESKIEKNISNKAFKIYAPLPGSIFKIIVKEGDTVNIGDNLLILEAMKMENNVLSEKAGKIQSIKVKEGDSVLQNDLLIEII